MDFMRFSSSQRYGTRVPLRQLAFRVTVSRAYLIEDERPEVLCEVTIPWNSKLPSPSERLRLFQQLHGAMAAADSTTNSNDGGWSAGPLVAEVTDELRRPASQLFTRPTVEDFIDAGEEDFPVDPPQGPSLLAPIVLRQHRRDHLPNNNMFIMWATGGLGDDAASGAPRPSINPGGSTTTAHYSSPALLDAALLRWVGEERVLCRLTAERNEGFFTARPSLNEPHTILVDAVHIYSFVIRAVDVASLDTAEADGRHNSNSMSDSSTTVGHDAGGRRHHHRRTSASAGGGPPDQNAMAHTMDVLSGRGAAHLGLAVAATSALAAAEQVTESIRAVSAEAAGGMEALRLAPTPAGADGSGWAEDPDAQARRMLRDAAMAIADSRAALSALASAEVVPAAAAGTTAAPSGIVLSGTVGGMSATYDGSARGGGTVTPRRAGSGSSTATATTAATVLGAVTGDRVRYYVYGVVERTLGLPYDAVYLKCCLQQDTEPTSTSSSGGLPQFFLEQEALLSRGAGGRVFSTQLAYAGAVTVEDYLVQVDHCFNVPFEHSYVDDALPKAPLRLAVAAFSEGFGGEGHQTPVGYCSVSLPVLAPGTHTVHCPLWTPHMTGSEFVKAVVAGGGPSLVDLRDSAAPVRGRTGIAVRQGLLADSQGLVTVTVNIVHQRGAM